MAWSAVVLHKYCLQMTSWELRVCGGGGGAGGVGESSTHEADMEEGV